MNNRRQRQQKYDPKAFARLVDQTRAALGWNFDRLAEESGLSVHTLMSARRGASRLKRPTRLALVNALSRAVDEADISGVDREKLLTAAGLDEFRVGDRVLAIAGERQPRVFRPHPQRSASRVSTIDRDYRRAVRTLAESQVSMHAALEALVQSQTEAMRQVVAQMQELSEELPEDRRATLNKLTAMMVDSISRGDDFDLSQIVGTSSPVPARSESPASIHPVTTDPWRDLLGPILTVEQVQKVLRLETIDEVEVLVSQGELLVLPTEHGPARYPAFQFTVTGEVLPEIPAILEIFGRAVETPYTVASWLKSPKEYLEGETPIAWLERGRDPGRVLAGAEQSAARLAS